MNKTMTVNEKNEIKKSLYKEKPISVLVEKSSNCYHYECVLDNKSKIKFKVPINEMGEKLFENEVPAQLLIRWLHLPLSIETGYYEEPTYQSRIDKINNHFQNFFKQFRVIIGSIKN